MCVIGHGYGEFGGGRDGGGGWYAFRAKPGGCELSEHLQSAR